MGDHFRILIYHNGENLHLKLAGDFDGEAARELIDILSRYGFSAHKVFVHTSALESIHPDGQALFERSLATFNHSASKLIFTGPHQLAKRPYGSFYTPPGMSGAHEPALGR